MKKMFIGLMLVAMSVGVYAGTKCERSPTGGICCWDTDKEGIFQPIGC